MRKVVVIGAGHNGLVAAYNLRRRGFCVSVLEASNKIGGMADTSEIFGVKVSRASYVLGVMPKPLVELFEIPVIEQDPYEVIVYEGKPIALWKEKQRRRKEFEKAGIERYSEFEQTLLNFKEVLKKFTFVTKPPSREEVLEEAKKVGAEDFLLKSCEALLSRYLPKELHHSFYYPGMNNSSAYLVAYFFAEWQVVKGGMGAVAQSVFKKALEIGVEVRLNTKVERILISKDRVLGVEADGKKFEADIVLSTASPVATASLLCHAPNFRFEAGKSNWRKHNVILKSYPKPPDVIKGYLNSLIDLESMGAGEIVFPSLCDDTLGGKVLNVMGELEPLFELFPDLKDCIKVVDTLTPKLAEKLYNLPGGNVNHLPMKEPYLFDERPKKGMGYRTPIKGLYMGGAGTYPGGQVSGVPGYNASNAVIEDFERGEL
jgi:phytoene dehydrogenase-like protein